MAMARSYSLITKIVVLLVAILAPEVAIGEPGGPSLGGAPQPNHAASIPDTLEEIVDVIFGRLIADVSGQLAGAAEHWIAVVFLIVDTRQGLQQSASVDVLANDFEIRLALDLAQSPRQSLRHWKPLTLRYGDGTLDAIAVQALHAKLAKLALKFPSTLHTILVAMGTKLLPKESVGLFVVGTIQPDGGMDWILVGSFRKRSGEVFPVYRDLAGSTRDVAAHITGMVESMSR